jgi:hypothetical protein
MVHPYEFYDDNRAIESMNEIIVTLMITTLYKGLPHGIALIRHIDPDSKTLSFAGVGVFVHGKLHNAPFSCFDDDLNGLSFSNMQNGRPADGCMKT